MQRRLSIVIPCRNEEEAIPSVMARFNEARPSLHQAGIRDIEVIVVDDGSTDASATLLSQHEDVIVISSGAKGGYGGALKTGFARCSGDLIAFYDMDNTYDPFHLVPMIENLDEKRAALVCGDRLSQCENMPLTRKIGNTLFVLTIGFLFRRKIYDSCTGLRVFRREYLNHFVHDSLPNNLNYSLAMTMYCLSHGIPLIELPIRYEKRIGSSKLKVLVDGPRFFLTILGHWTRYDGRQLIRRLTTF